MARLMIYIVALSVMVGCAAAADDCSVQWGYSPALNYFPENTQLQTDIAVDSSAKITIAEDFAVTYFNSYKLVENMRAGESYVLYQCGTPQPDVPSLANTTKFFQVPINRVSTTLTVAIGFMEALGVTDRLALVDMQLVTSPCLKKREQECGDLNHLSGGLWEATAAATELVFTDNWGGGASNTNIDVKFDASSDPGILHTAEWIKFISVFFNKEAEANTIFQNTVNEVNMIKAEGATLASPPTVAWVTRSDFPGWEAFTIYNTPYRKEYIEEAGGVMYTNNGSAFAFPLSAYEDMASAGAAFKDAVKNVHVLIDEMYLATPGNLTQASWMAAYYFTAEDITSGDYPFLTNDNVWRVDKAASQDDYEAKSNGLDWFERRMPFPQLVMEDMAYIMSPTTFPQYSETTFFRNVLKNEEVGLSMAAHCTKECAVYSSANPNPIQPIIQATTTQSPTEDSSANPSPIPPPITQDTEESHGTITGVGLATVLAIALNMLA